MNVTFYTFNKKSKSTARPSGTGLTLDCALKDPTSVMQPTLLVASAEIVGKNYAYVPAFARYYFVTDLTYVNGLYEVSLNRDPYASFKSQIGNYTGLILRLSDVSAYNAMLTDSDNPPTLDVSVSVEVTALKDGRQIQNLFHAGGFYLLGVAGQPPLTSAAGGANGLSRYFFLNAAEMAQLAIIMNDASFLQSLKTEFQDPLSAITQITFLPLSSTSFTSTTIERIKLGSFDTGLNGILVEDRFIRTTNVLTLPSGMTDEHYLNREPYAYATINLPFVGVVDLPLDQLSVGLGTEVSTTIDVFTGDVMHVIHPTTGRRYRYTYTGNCATRIQITGQNVSVIGTAQGIMQSIGGVSTDNFGMAINGAITTLKGMQKQSQIWGANSSALGAYGDLAFTVRYLKRTPAHGATDAAAVNGLPYCKVSKPSSHPGYLVFQDANVAISGTEGEREEINSGLNSGFYYE